MRRIAGNGIGVGKMIQIQKIPNTPGYEMIGTRCVAAESDSAHDFLSSSVKRKSAAKHIDSTNLATDHRVVAGTEVCGRPVVGNPTIDRIAKPKPEEAPARLDGGIKIGG